MGRAVRCFGRFANRPYGVVGACTHVGVPLWVRRCADRAIKAVRCLGGSRTVPLHRIVCMRIAYRMGYLPMVRFRVPTFAFTWARSHTDAYSCGPCPSRRHVVGQNP